MDVASSKSVTHESVSNLLASMVLFTFNSRSACVRRGMTALLNQDFSAHRTRCANDRWSDTRLRRGHRGEVREGLEDVLGRPRQLALVRLHLVGQGRVGGIQLVDGFPRVFLRRTGDRWRAVQGARQARAITCPPRRIQRLLSMIPGFPSPRADYAVTCSGAAPLARGDPGAEPPEDALWASSACSGAAAGPSAATAGLVSLGFSRGDVASAVPATSSLPRPSLSFTALGGPGTASPTTACPPAASTGALGGGGAIPASVLSAWSAGALAGGSAPSMPPQLAALPSRRPRDATPGKGLKLLQSRRQRTAWATGSFS